MEAEGWIGLTIVLAILATLVQIGGYVVPLWIWLEAGKFEVGVGLWYTIGCGTEGSCNATVPDLAFGYGKKDIYDKPAFNAVRGLETVGLALGVLLVLFLGVYRCGYGSWTSMGQLNLTAFITCSLAWMCILAGLIVYCASFWPIVGTSPFLTSRSWPWALLICFVAALLFIVVSVLIRLKCKERGYVQHAIPTSGDSKMDLNPVTKHGLFHRYFTPIQYNENRRANFAIAGHDEGTLVPSMDRHLIGAEDQHTLEGSGLENGVHYRYIPPGGQQAGGISHSENPVVRRTLPNAVVVYPNTSDHGKTTAMHVQTGAFVTNHVMEGSANQAVYHRGGRAPQHQQHHHGGLAVNGDVTSSGSASPRDGFYGRDTDGLLRVHASRNVTSAAPRERESPVYSVVTRHATAGERGQAERGAENNNEARYTKDGRMMADFDVIRAKKTKTEALHNYINGTDKQHQQQLGNDLNGDIHHGVLLEHTNHSLALGPTPGPRIINPLGDNLKPYDPTFIYRPFSEDQQQQLY